MPDPSLSVVVEWDNAHWGELRRCEEMLRRLQAQAREVRGPVELLVAYDDAKVDPALVEGVLGRVLDRDGHDVSAQAFPLTGGDYYALKNAGAERARADVVVLVDSDVIPEPGWLAELVRPLDDPDVQVAVGNTYIEPAGLVGKTFALGWVFPLRDEADAPTSAADTAAIWAGLANNAAFRRDVLARFPFPSVAGTARASGIELERTLRAHGVELVYTPRARVAHPHVWSVADALSEGRDGTFRRAQGLVDDPGIGRSIARFAEVIRSIVAGRRRVGLSAAQLPAAVAVAASYYGLVTVGRVLARLRPGVMATRFKV